MDRDAHREKYKKKRDKKKGGSTNKKKLKNKPFSMIKRKKIDSMNERFENTKTKLKRLKVQLGKYKKN